MRHSAHVSLLPRQKYLFLVRKTCAYYSQKTTQRAFQNAFCVKKGCNYLRHSLGAGAAQNGGFLHAEANIAGINYQNLLMARVSAAF